LPQADREIGFPMLDMTLATNFTSVYSTQQGINPDHTAIIPHAHVV